MSKSKSKQSESDIFWEDQERIRELRSLASIYLSIARDEKGARPLSKLLKLAGSEHSELEPAGSEAYQSLNRFLLFVSRRPKDARLLDALAIAVFAGLDELSHQHAHLQEAFDPMVRLREQFSAYREQRSTIHTGFEAMLSPKQFKLNFSEEQSAAAADYLAGHLWNGEEEAYYACFRYSSVVGLVAKSSLIVVPGKSKGDLCRFRNRFKDRWGAIREAAGICFKVGDWVYFLAQMEDTAALKVLSVKASGRSADLLPGVLMSREDTPLVGRVALERQKKQLADTKIGERPEKSSSEFKSLKFITRIRPMIMNEVEFESQGEILYKPARGAKPVPIEQSEMVAKVGSLLEGRFFVRGSGRGASKLNPFNPARHSHYPFNQAISPSEK